MQSAHNEYHMNQIETADPKQLVIMLYDGAGRFLERAAAEIDNFKKYDNVNTNILKAQDIITELMLSLDMEQGGEIADNLLNLYAFMKKELLEANMKKEKGGIVQVIKMLDDLKEAWVKMEPGSEVKKEAPPERPKGGFVAQG
ncbi:MAG: flagellar export chaperone FliS [Leptospirales bacterium]